ncbi:hypothetical protein IJM86_08850 [bacterium]|nr:hypothetical protein [bacterium]
MGENEEKKTKKTRSTSVKKTIKNTNKKTADEGLKQAKTYAQSKPVFVAAKKDHKFIIVDTAPELENSNEKEINEENKEREKKKKIPVAIWAFF